MRAEEKVEKEGEPRSRLNSSISNQTRAIVIQVSLLKCTWLYVIFTSEYLVMDVSLNWSLGVVPVLGHWVWCGIQVQRLRDSCFALASLHCHIPPMKEWQQ